MRHFLLVCTNSIGSSMVRMWPNSVLFLLSIIAASEVDLPDAVVEIEHADEETRESRDLERKVGLEEFFKVFALLVAHDVVQHRVHGLIVERRHIDAAHVAVDSDHGR